MGVVRREKLGGDRWPRKEAVSARIRPSEKGRREPRPKVGNGGLQEPNGVKCVPRQSFRFAKCLSWARYQRCQDEASRPLGLHVQVRVRTPCTDKRPRSGEECSAIGTFNSPGVSSAGCAGAPSCRRPEAAAVRTARGKASHLPHHGFPPGTREPRAERRERNARQAAKPGNVSVEGQSPRSSRSAGKPRTGRRGAVESGSCEVAGVSHVCGL